MDLKQKKTIFWSVVITLLLSTSLFTWFTFEGINQEGIWRGIFGSLLFSSILFSLPSVIFYRLLIGRIKVGDGESSGFYYVWISILGIIILTVLTRRLGGYLSNPPRELIILYELIILLYIIHKILKRFVFDFKKEEEQ
jgi:hypothetical protein